MMRIIQCFILGIMLFASTVGFARHAPFLLSKNIFNYIGQPGNQRAQLIMLGGYRIYNSGSGQFLKQDSYSPFRGDHMLNGFGYVAGNPVLFVDMTGHAPMPTPISWDEDALTLEPKSSEIQLRIRHPDCIMISYLCTHDPQSAHP